MFTNTRFGTCKKLHDFSHFTRRVFHELIGFFTHPWAKTLSLSPSMHVSVYRYICIYIYIDIYIYLYKYVLSRNINTSIHIYVLVGEPNPLTTTSNRTLTSKTKNASPTTPIGNFKWCFSGPKHCEVGQDQMIQILQSTWEMDCQAGSV